MPSSTAASACARDTSSVTRHSMPTAMSSSRPAALMRGADRETDVGGGQRCQLATRDLGQRAQAGAALPRRRRCSPAATSSAIVVIQRHQVRDRADRDQVAADWQGRLCAGKTMALAQVATQGQQQVEHHADTGQRLAREGIAGKVRIDDHVGRRQGRSGQVVVGDQHLPAARLGGGDAGMAGDAVVDGHQQVGLTAPPGRPPGPADRP